SHFRGNDGRADSVAPDKCRNLKSRHSRAGGNLDLRTTAIFKDYLKVRESSSFGFACFKFRVTSTSSFPRRRESRHSMLRQFLGNG
ncbi:hypothetical protein E0W57_12075, partial [Neisseria meningitidis]|nr:hypothetical protein [Neisseria meningitidis]